MRTFTLLALSSLLAGCASETYSRSPRALGGQEVRVRTEVEDATLFTVTSAGRYSVEHVTLVLADGSTLEPTLSATTQQADRPGGGFRVGTGIGAGVGGGVGVGVGTSVPIGGSRRAVVAGVREARWESPPFSRQPFTLRITVATEPPVVAHVPLGRVEKSESSSPDAPRIETWKLPDGTTRTFHVTDPADENVPPTYQPVE